MFHAYTFGKDSKQFLIMTPAQADLNNRFTQAFFNSQKDFLETNGQHWGDDYTQPLPFVFDEDFTEKDLAEYNDLVDRLNRQHKIRNKIFSFLRIDVSQEEIDDFLVKRI